MLKKRAFLMRHVRWIRYGFSACSLCLVSLVFPASATRTVIDRIDVYFPFSHSKMKMKGCQRSNKIAY